MDQQLRFTGLIFAVTAVSISAHAVGTNGYLIAAPESVSESAAWVSDVLPALPAPQTKSTTSAASATQSPVHSATPRFDYSQTSGIGSTFTNPNTVDFSQYRKALSEEE
ncbi:MAG: hypothetical protein ACQKBV_06575 [Puniceicoccales bacterium]